MGRTARRLMMVAGLVMCLGVPQGALAISYEDSLDDCSYPKMFDLMILRPLGLTSFMIGTALMVPLFPLGMLTTIRDLGSVKDSLLSAPLAFTFKRRLGECAGVVSAY